MNFAAAILLALVPSAERRGETTYHFGTAEARTTIGFGTKTNLGSVSGSTHTMKGSATIDFDAGTGSCRLIVPVASMRTGLAGTDNALLSPEWFDTANHPNLEFVSEKVSFTKPSTWQIDGKFKLRGVEKAISIAVDVRKIPELGGKTLGEGSWIRVKTSFPLKFSWFGIKVPDSAAGSVSDDVNVEIAILGTTAKPKDTEAVTGATEEEKYVKARPVTLEGANYRFNIKDQLTKIMVESRTETETFTARSSRMAGMALMDLEKGSGQMKLSIPLEALKSGMKKLDEELHGAVFEIATHPDILFETTRLERKDEKSWTMEGTLTLHGKSGKIVAEVASQVIPAEDVIKFRWGRSQGLKLVTSFKVKLSDYGVKVPAGRMSDEVTLSLDLIALATR